MPIATFVRVNLQGSVVEKKMDQRYAGDDFDAILLQEIEILKAGERRLEKLFAQLRTRPQLRDCFLMELSEVRQRADRLSAVLNPFPLVMPSAVESPGMRPAA
jgi:hypothetical protein